MKKYERIAALFLVVFSLTTGLYSWLSLHLMDAGEPDSGLMPFVASLLVLICSISWLIDSLGRDENPQPFWENKAWLRPLLAVAIILVYALTMDPLGYILSSLVFMLAWQFLVERSKWLSGIIIAVASTAGMWALFALALGVPVSKGLLPF